MVFVCCGGSRRTSPSSRGREPPHEPHLADGCSVPRTSLWDGRPQQIPGHLAITSTCWDGATRRAWKTPRRCQAASAGWPGGTADKAPAIRAGDCPYWSPSASKGAHDCRWWQGNWRAFLRPALLASGIGARRCCKGDPVGWLPRHCAVSVEVRGARTPPSSCRTLIVLAKVGFSERATDPGAIVCTFWIYLDYCEGPISPRAGPIVVLNRDEQGESRDFRWSVQW